MLRSEPRKEVLKLKGLNIVWSDLTLAFFGFAFADSDEHIEDETSRRAKRCWNSILEFGKKYTRTAKFYKGTSAKLLSSSLDVVGFSANQFFSRFNVAFKLCLKYSSGVELTLLLEVYSEGKSISFLYSSNCVSSTTCNTLISGSSGVAFADTFKDLCSIPVSPILVRVGEVSDKYLIVHFN